MNASDAASSHHRIALVTGGLEMGGSTTFLINFAGELVLRGIAVEVMSFESENPMAADFERQNIPVLTLDQGRMIFEDRLDILLQRLAAFRPTTVVATLAPTSFEVLRYVPAGVFRVAMGQSNDPKVHQIQVDYQRWLDLFVVVSLEMEKTAKELSAGTGVPVRYIPYGVSQCAESELPIRDFSLPLRILYLGRLVQEQKRVRYFPDILNRLIESGMPFHWTIAGDGTERAFLQETLKSNSPSQTVSFTGHVSYKDVPALLRDHDIFLLASDYEGLPLSLLEAMSYGMIPVASNLASGISQVVDHLSGMTVEVSNIPGYADAIIALNNNRLKLPLLSEAARRRVEREFTRSVMTDNWLASLPPADGLIDPWPKSFCITAPRTAVHTLYYSPFVRVLRRILLIFRALVR